MSRSDETTFLGENWTQTLIAVLAIVAIAAHLILRYAVSFDAEILGFRGDHLPLIVALVLGGAPLVYDLVVKVFRREFGSDLLAGISIVTSVILGEYLAGTFVVLMLSGGEALEGYAVRSASAVLKALAARLPSVAHRTVDGSLEDIALDDVQVGDRLIVFPHETCPVDGTVINGHGSMDESYLTGEPYVMSKTPGSEVLSGAINGESALTIRADKLAVDSRYARIMSVMRESEQRRPRLRRLGDQLGAFYTPLAVAIAIAAWGFSGDPTRFLAVLVVATPCPLLIAIPVSIIGSVSLAARRGIIIKDPAALEKMDTCRTAIFDKTGTLTYGQPRLTEILPAEGVEVDDILALVGSLERYSKHPLSDAIVSEAQRRGLAFPEVERISEKPGEGLTGFVGDSELFVTSRRKLLTEDPDAALLVPPQAGGLECVIMLDGRYAATFRFRDEPRSEGKSFISHLKPKHHFDRIMIVSGDRESEVQYLARKVGIEEVYHSYSPEEKLRLVEAETQKAPTVFLGDGINDAPALTAATVGIAFGQHSDITSEAAGVVIMDTSLEKVDELLHVSRRMRAIALQSAVGGMALSVVGMGFASFGFLPPVAGAISQEIIDVFAVLNALRAVFPPKELTDY